MRLASIGDSELEVWDRGTGPSLLFIHGVGTSGQAWPRNWAAHAEDAIALIEKLRAAPLILVGYSGGAMIAVKVALKRPDLLARLVLLDPAFNLNRCLTPGIVRTIATVKLLRWLCGDRAAAECWMRYVSSYSTGGSAFETAPEARREQLLANSGGLFADLASGGATIDESLLGNITAPVTIVDAALSPPFLRRSSRRLKQLLPQAGQVTLEQSGHWVALDAHEELIGILREAAH